MHLKNLLLITIFCGLSPLLAAQGTAPALNWQHCYGGSKNEEFRTMNLTPDGGFIAAGYSQSEDGDVATNLGASDEWIVKVDINHNIEWKKNYGGSSIDWVRSIACTADGGYIVAGYSKSTDGTITNNHGDFDYLILKLDESGDIVWHKSLGGSGFENVYSVIQSSDGNYVVAGFTESNDGNVSGNHGGQDYWIVKLNSNGGIIWKKTFGGSLDEQAACIIESRDHCYVIAGFAESSDGDITDSKGAQDFWVIKINEDGTKIWAKSYGGGKDDAARWLEQTPDGNYIVTGFATSNAKDVKGNHGKQDFWVIKIDSLGELLWQKCYGGSNDDYPYCIHRCKDGSFLVSGFSTSSDYDVTVNYGDEDGWIIQTDSAGNLRWQQTIGGKKLDEIRSCHEAEDGSFLFAGFTLSNNIDVSGNHGLSDGWVAQTCIPPLSIITDGSVVNSCKDNDVTLAAYSSPGYSYQWNKNGKAISGATKKTYIYSGSGEADFTVSVTNNISCSSTSATTTVYRYDKPQAYIKPLGDLNICYTGSVILKAYGSDFTYTWWKNDVLITGATEKKYTATSTGEYKVTVTDTITGCSKKSPAAKVTSSCKEMEVNNSSVSVMVAPNPSGGNFQLSVTSEVNNQAILLITDIMGRTLYEEMLLLFAQKNLFTITLPDNFNNGIYLLSIRGESMNQNARLIIRR